MIICVSPTGNFEIWETMPATYSTVEDWLAANPPKIDLQAELLQIQNHALEIISQHLRKQTIQTENFAPGELSLFARVGLFDKWVPGAKYAAKQRIAHEMVVYEVIQPVTSIASQPPNAAGMLAIYRPISVDAETGGTQSGAIDNPISFITGMDVSEGLYYFYNDKVYLAKANMTPCVWPPDSPGLWQWEVVT